MVARGVPTPFNPPPGAARCDGGALRGARSSDPEAEPQPLRRCDGRTRRRWASSSRAGSALGSWSCSTRSPRAARATRCASPARISRRRPLPPPLPTAASLSLPPYCQSTALCRAVLPLAYRFLAHAHPGARPDNPRAALRRREPLRRSQAQGWSLAGAGARSSIVSS